MENKTAKTWMATVYIAGQISSIESILREWVLRESTIRKCVTLEKCLYIFKGGSEEGARVGIIQYPRFVEPETTLRNEAIALTEHLIEQLHQLSASVVMPDETVWIYREDKPKSALA